MEENEQWLPDRSRFRDRTGKYITQSLFLENGYNTELAVYTLTDEDKEYKGKVYPSLRRLFLECMDPTEYVFATTYLWGWEHWQRICANKMMAEFIEPSMRMPTLCQMEKHPTICGLSQRRKWYESKLFSM